MTPSSISKLLSVYTVSLGSQVTMWDAFFISKRAMDIPPFRGRPPSLLSLRICSVFLFNRLKYAKF